MNKITKSFSIILSFLFLIIACKEEPKNYATFSGKVDNLSADIDSVLVFIPNGYKKSIALNSDGTFSDTLNIKEGKYKIKIGDEYGTIYLKNNESLHLMTDYKDFDQALEFSGTGEILEKTKVETEILHLMLTSLKEEVASLPKEEFDANIQELRENYAALKTKYNNLAPSFWKDSDEEIEKNITGFTAYKNNKAAVMQKFTGITSPTFAMENIEGKIVRLEDFQGKFVYVDVWATWCGPCKREIPSLKKIEEEYKDKNLVVVSMSIDELKDKEKWRNFVIDENLQGVQIFAENAWNSDFVKAYEIKGIPRFILIGPEGKVISPDAPRPSDPKLIELFNQLEI